MIEIAHLPLVRRVVLGLGLGGLIVCAAAGGLAWHWSRCNFLDDANRASASPRDRRERYLFACGRVWRSLDGGQEWEQLETLGLPFGMQEGYIAVDLKPGFLYLGVILAAPGSIQCWDCAWSQRIPAVYVSIDGGHTWSLAHQFKPGPVEDVSFVGVFVDPRQDVNAWTVLLYDEDILYYNSQDGRNWTLICDDRQLDMMASRCELPDQIDAVGILEE